MAGSTSLKSIAYELGISINTVSRALRDCDDISESTKEKVRQKAFEMGYVPNSVSQFIKRDGRKLIAVVLNNFKNPYFQIISDKLVNLLADKGYDFTTVYSSTKKLDLNLLKQCISQRVDAVFTLLEPEPNVIDCAKLNKMPIAMVGRHSTMDFIDEVYTDDELGGQLVAHYLSNYHTISKFVYIKMPNVECSKRRQDAFKETVKSINPEADVMILEPKQINSTLITAINKGYLGIFAFNDELAYQVLKSLNKQVPNVRKVYPHLHIVGFDCVSTRIPGFIDITSVDFDYDAIVQESFEMIEDKFEHPEREKKSVMFPVTLHTRKYF